MSVKTTNAMRADGAAAGPGPDDLLKTMRQQFRRFRMVAVTSALFLAYLSLLSCLGHIGWAAAMTAAASTAALVALCLALIRTGLYRRIGDEALDTAQTVAASGMVFIVMYQADGARGSLAVFLLIILFTGVLRHSPKPALYRAALLLGGYAGVIALAAVWKPDRASLALDLAYWGATAVAMAWFAWAGSYIERLRARLRERKVFYQSIWEACSDAVLVVDDRNIIQYANHALATLSGSSPIELIGKPLDMLRPKSASHSTSPSLFALIEAHRPHPALPDAGASRTARTQEMDLLRPDGRIIGVEVTNSYATVNDRQMTVAFIRDISERRRNEEHIRHLAHHDSLTGLPNRSLLNDRLSHAIHYATRYGTGIWVIFMDLDRFKIVNDSLGHQAGDTLLNIIAERLRSSVREIDTVARLGGDEFVVILPEQSERKPTVCAVQRLMQAVAQPCLIEGHEFFIGCSMGISVFPSDGRDADTLIAHADMAMYRAKETGRNNFQFYTSALNEGILDRLALERDLRNAIEHKELELHYQPQVDLRTGEIVGMEALLRWKHPTRGMVSPGTFIRIAEETGLIISIGEWVLRTACAQNKAWQLAGLGMLRIAVNLSLKQFIHAGLTEAISSILRETGLDAKYLDIELTESLVMTDVDKVIGILNELKRLGVQISVDDFGTGYSSLAYLSRFPINVLKVDQSFVKNVCSSTQDASIVASIISLAHNLRLHVIAEGVESESQLHYLRRHGCNEMQGYLFSAPVPPDTFEGMVRERKRLAAYAHSEDLLMIE